MEVKFILPEMLMIENSFKEDTDLYIVKSDTFVIKLINEIYIRSIISVIYFN